MILPITRRAALFAATALPLLPRLAMAGPAVGQPAPDFLLPDQDGAMHRLQDYRGKLLVLEWTNHECPYVRKHYGSGNMQSLQALAADKGVVWLSIASSPEGEQGHVTGAEAKELTVSRGARPEAVLLDPMSRAARAYQATTTPEMFVIGRDGTLLYMGGIDSIRSTRPADIERAEPYLRNALLAAVEGRPVEPSVTRPYGCAVKYAPAA
ncbi:redoxin domain-containing protein [Geminicoccus flavidas]|uniref:redoxin domain-containing protein n=1 Tax=Geminicoccus flavidas TaxID=2506407 RepID=UPI00135CDE4E|nr:redoxin domain-containing protein [Geminicoccus flavidas]